MRIREQHAGAAHGNSARATCGNGHGRPAPVSPENGPYPRAR
ncbi:hypothetical protein BSLA_01r0669 [Burkholderia stabilis]|nr:hypothetical protein BSLA_01r0669 [Burkholderia stabilis]